VLVGRVLFGADVVGIFCFVGGGLEAVDFWEGGVVGLGHVLEMLETFPIVFAFAIFLHC
jgi:hypothetical protein